MVRIERLKLHMERDPVAGWGFFLPIFMVQFLSWGGMFALWVFALPHVRAQLALTETIALQYVGIGLAVTVGVGALANFALPLAHGYFGKVITHAIGLAIGGCGLLVVGHALNATMLICGYALTGLGWSSISTTPYALVSERVSDGRYELAMARFNLSVVLPQICLALALGRLVVLVAPTIAIVAGGYAMLAAAAVSLILVRTAYRD
jgi:maltose/moltooligosaccharide transporter